MPPQQTEHQEFMEACERRHQECKVDADFRHAEIMGMFTAQNEHLESIATSLELIAKDYARSQT